MHMHCAHDLAAPQRSKHATLKSWEEPEDKVIASASYTPLVIIDARVLVISYMCNKLTREEIIETIYFVH